MDTSIITDLCDDKRLSVKDLATKVGLSFSGLYSAIRNNSLKIETLEKIAEALNVPITVFFGIDSKKNETEALIFNEDDLQFFEKELELVGANVNIKRKEVLIDMFKNSEAIDKKDLLRLIVTMEHVTTTNEFKITHLMQSLADERQMKETYKKLYEDSIGKKNNT